MPIHALFAQPALFSKFATRICAAVALVIGGGWLVAWISGAPPRWGVSMITVKTNMALAQFLGAAGLLLVAAHDLSFGRRLAGGIIAFILIPVGSLTFTQHLTGADFGIDQLLYTEPPGALATVAPNRMGPPGSLCVALAGCGLLALATGYRRVAPLFGIGIIAIALVPVIGYLSSVSQFYSDAKVTGIAWYSLAALCSIGLGLIIAYHEGPPLEHLLRNDAGGVLLRRALPVTVALQS